VTGLDCQVGGSLMSRSRALALTMAGCLLAPSAAVADATVCPNIQAVIQRLSDEQSFQKLNAGNCDTDDGYPDHCDASDTLPNADFCQVDKPTEADDRLHRLYECTWSVKSDDEALQDYQNLFADLQNCKQWSISNVSNLHKSAAPSGNDHRQSQTLTTSSGWIFNLRYVDHVNESGEEFLITLEISSPAI